MEPCEAKEQERSAGTTSIRGSKPVFDKSKIYILDGDNGGHLGHLRGLVNPNSDPCWPASALKVSMSY